MDTQLLILLVVLSVASIGGIVVLYFLLFPKYQSSLKSLMGDAASLSMGTSGQVRDRLKGDQTGEEYAKIKKETKKKVAGKVQIPLEEKLFRAGIYSSADKKAFNTARVVIPICFAVIFISAGFYYASGILSIVIGAIGTLAGFQLPLTILDKKIKARDDEIMYYLPLVIEQVAIGVSSSLDIGPCLQRVVQMADERDTHNCVTELLRHAQYHIRSGVSLEDALVEVGKRSGHTELKHAFMALSQVARHGGEISRQLQELADAVSGQREAKIEGVIKTLELWATGPVAMVFCGFLIILLIGFGLQIYTAFGN